MMFNLSLLLFLNISEGEKVLGSCVCVCIWERREGSCDRKTLNNHASKIQAVFRPMLLKIPVHMRAGGPAEAGGSARAAFSPVLSFNSWPSRRPQASSCWITVVLSSPLWPQLVEVKCVHERGLMKCLCTVSEMLTGENSISLLCDCVSKWAF